MERELHLFEELCKKGKAYRAKRMAAGEKSSAYLSGRAVKVCKGQMQGEGEDIEEMDLQYRKGYKDLTGLYKKVVSTNDIGEKKKLSHVFIDSLKRISREKRYQHKQAIQNGSASMINNLITNLYMRDNKMTSEVYEEIDALHENEEYCPKCATKIKEAIREEVKKVAKEAKTKPAKGKRFAKKVKNPKTGRTRTVSYGQAGKAKKGGDRIRPGTKKGDAYCARSAKIKKCKNPPCANTLSRKKWKCRGTKSMR